MARYTGPAYKKEQNYQNMLFNYKKNKKSDLCMV